MVNKVVLIGRVGKDPDIRHLDQGVSVASFSLATSETYKNKNGEKVVNTEWHNIVLWRQLAMIAENFIRKGSLVYIEGRIRTRSYDDQEGKKRYVTEIVGDSLQLLDRKPSDESSAAGGYNTNNAPAQDRPSQLDNAASPVFDSEDGPDDLPF